MKLSEAVWPGSMEGKRMSLDNAAGGKATTLTDEDIENVSEVLSSQIALGHTMTLMPTDVLSRLLDAARVARATGPHGTICRCGLAKSYHFGRANLAEHKYVPRYGPQEVTHGRHCTCTPCRVEDWTNPNLAHCGMHGPSCPAEYQPLGSAGSFLSG